MKTDTAQRERERKRECCKRRLVAERNRENGGGEKDRFSFLCDRTHCKQIKRERLHLSGFNWISHTNRILLPTHCHSLRTRFPYNIPVSNPVTEVLADLTNRPVSNSRDVHGTYESFSIVFLSVVTGEKWELQLLV